MMQFVPRESERGGRLAYLSTNPSGATVLCCRRTSFMRFFAKFIGSAAEIVFVGRAVPEPGVHGFITAHSPEALAKPLLWLAADPTLRNQIGQNARMRIEGKSDPALVYQQLWQFCEKGYE